MSFEELVNLERQRQDDKWGEQNHSPFVWLAILGEEVGELQNAVLERIHLRNQNTKSISSELIQIAAVAKAMLESLIRQGYLVD